MTNQQLENEVKKLLEEADINYIRVYVYEGCTEENCGPMPRVIVKESSSSTPICYNIPELKKYIGLKKHEKHQ